MSCKTTKPSTDSTSQKVVQMDESQLEKGTERMVAPNLLIYKTRMDYSNNVPVILSADKSQMVTYPAPSDLAKGGILQKPISLHNGYWLDRRGINKNVTFLKITYEEYFKLKQTVPIAEMLNQILDKDPLLEMYDSGSHDLNDELILKLNAWIDSGSLRTTCKVIK